MSKLNTCRCCKGSGVEADDVLLGSNMRKKRIAAGIRQKDMAKTVGVSSAMLSLLEAGKRHWTLSLTTAVYLACKTQKL